MMLERVRPDDADKRDQKEGRREMFALLDHIKVVISDVVGLSRRAYSLQGQLMLTCFENGGWKIQH